MIEQYLNNINLLPKVSGVYSIVNVLKSRYAYGYLWSKVKYDKIDPYFGKKASRSRNVDQLTLDGQFINKHNSSAEAAESFGYRNGRFWIKDCILGKRQEAFGFKWRYSNDK